MTTVTIQGVERITEALEWLKVALPKANVKMDLNQSDPFGGKFAVVFEQPNDAVVFALRWGNEYGNERSSL